MDTALVEPSADKAEDIPAQTLTRSLDTDLSLDKEVSKLNQDLNLCESSETNEKPKANIDIFLSLFESWNNQNTVVKSECLELAKKLELAEKKNQRDTTRISDLETTVNLLECNVNSLQNDLDLVNKLQSENQNLKKKLNDETLKYEHLLKESNDKQNDLETEIDTLIQNHEKQVLDIQDENHRKLEKCESEMKTALQEKDEEIDKLVKDNQSKIASLTQDYEDRISKLQRQKTVATMNQQGPSINQEIYRRKLQHLKQEYEERIGRLNSEIASLKYQQRPEANGDSAQFQRRPGTNRDSTMPNQNRMTVTSANTPSNKRMRRF